MSAKGGYASNATPVPGTLRYGIEQLAGRRWIAFDKSLFTSTLSDSRRGAFFNFDRQLHITQGNITIDGRAWSVNGAGRVVVLRRSYNWYDYTVTGTGSKCVANPTPMPITIRSDLHRKKAMAESGSIARNPPRGYYGSAATPDIINIRAMNPVSAYTALNIGTYSMLKYMNGR